MGEVLYIPQYQWLYIRGMYTYKKYIYNNLVDTYTQRERESRRYWICVARTPNGNGCRRRRSRRQRKTRITCHSRHCSSCRRHYRIRVCMCVYIIPYILYMHIHRSRVARRVPGYPRFGPPEVVCTQTLIARTIRLYVRVYRYKNAHYKMYVYVLNITIGQSISNNIYALCSHT